jgi:hypothetical protein
MRQRLARWARVARLPQAWAIAGLFLLLAVPPALSPRMDINYAWDEQEFHLPTVRRVAEHWPSLNFRDDELTAIAPGYYWFLAGVSKIVGSSARALRLVNILVSLTGLMVLFAWLVGRVGAADAAFLIAPLATSNIYIKSSSWVVTDNAALVLAVIALLHVLHSAQRSNAIAAGIYAALATFSRQLYAWLAFPMLYRALLSVRDRDKAMLAWTAASCGIVIVVVSLYLTWGGLVSPRWQKFYSPLSIVPLGYILSLIALFGVFYFPLEASPFRVRPLWFPSIIALLCAEFVAVIAPTAYDKAAGRWGGHLWEVAKILPAPFGRSIVFIVLAPIGMIFVMGFFRCIKESRSPEQAQIWLVALIGWSFVYIFDHQVFERYYEPMILVFLIIAAASRGTCSLKEGRVRLAALTVVQTVITFGTAWWGAFVA